jgi:hypothetical protein
MNETISISPAEGRRVLDPVRGTAIAAGERVVWSTYWDRKLSDQDITLDDDVIEAGGAAPPVIVRPRKPRGATE